MDAWSSTSFEWVEEPLPGMRFEFSSRMIDSMCGSTGSGMLERWMLSLSSGGSDESDEWVYRGSIDGPLCEGSSIALEIISGGEVEFAPLLRAGTYPAKETTLLAVSSSSSGWSLDHSLAFSLPGNTEQSVVERLFRLTISPRGSAARTTRIDVFYTLRVEDSDFSDLPEGTYGIGIAYTVTADDEPFARRG